MVNTRAITTRLFYCLIFSLGAFYFSIEIFLNFYTMLSADEFWFAHHTQQYLEYLPYRDFAPYKTVVGYYFLLPFMSLSKDIINTLVFTKHALAFVNCLIIMGASIWLSRYFSRGAILTSLFLFVTAEIVLTYSTNIRVDLFAYWFCLLGLLCLLDSRLAMTGLLFGLGFITSQKTLWCWLALNASLCIDWLCLNRNRNTLKSILHFNFMSATPLLLYIFFWAYFASPKIVIQSVFLEAVTMYQLEWYAAARALFWHTILLFNPFFFLLLPLTILSLVVTYQDDKTYALRLKLIVYSMFLLIFLIPYKQIFPYYLQIMYPALLTTYAAFFTWFYGLYQAQEIQLKSHFLVLLIVLCYLALLITLIIQLDLPYAYLIMGVIPIAFYKIVTNFHQSESQKLWRILQLIIALFMGVIYPIILFSIATTQLNGEYQRANLRAINNLLRDGSNYLAGVDLIYNKNQPIVGMRHLNGPSLAFLTNPSPELQKAMLPALELDPHVSIGQVLYDLKKTAVKFYVNNYRIMNLPLSLKKYLSNQFEHYWGSIYLYAPEIAAGRHHVRLKFPGQYLIETTSSEPVIINGKAYHANSVLFLRFNHLMSQATQPFRLKLLPSESNLFWNAGFQQDQWQKIIF